MVYDCFWREVLIREYSASYFFLHPSFRSFILYEYVGQNKYFWNCMTNLSISVYCWEVPFNGEVQLMQSRVLNIEIKLKLNIENIKRHNLGFYQKFFVRKL